MIRKVSEANIQVGLNFYVILLIFFATFSGVISNFAPSFGGLGLGTIFLDVILITGLFLVTLFQAQLKLFEKQMFFVILFFAFFSAILLIKSGIDNNSIMQRVLGWRNYIIYASPMIIAMFVRQNYSKHLRIMTFFLTLVCLFATSQYLFRNIYPDSFLKLNVENTEFSFYDTNIVRVNGLIGNTIIFTGFSLMACLLNINHLIRQKNKLYLLGLVISYAALCLTFSRAAWVIGTAVLILNYMLIIRLEIKRLLLLTSLLTLTSISFYSWLSVNTDSFIYRRLFSREASTRGSDTVHTNQIFAAIADLKAHPFAGVGLGTQGGSAKPKEIIITDGWILQTALEFGIPLTVLYVMGLIAVCVYSLWMMRYRQTTIDILAVTFFSITIYFFATSILNSALTGKTVYILYFVLLGLLLSAGFDAAYSNRIRRKNANYRL